MKFFSTRALPTHAAAQTEAVREILKKIIATSQLRRAQAAIKLIASTVCIPVGKGFLYG